MGSGESVLHTREQGKRVHVLANLGGLVAIAGLERVEPDLLLGALLEVANRLPRMKPERLGELRRRGAAALDARSTSKRAWRARQIALDLHLVHLTSEQILGLLRRLGARVPSDRRLLPQTLSDALQRI